MSDKATDFLEEKHNDFFFLVLGPSGSGKDTVVDILCKQTGRKQVMSCTTRPKRFPEEATHYFLTVEEADAVKDTWVAMTAYGGYLYGASAEEVKASTYYIIDPDGLHSFRQPKDDTRQLRTIVITAPAEIRANRMIQRGNTPKEVLSRLKLDAKVFGAHGYENVPEADYVIDNSGQEPETTAKKIVLWEANQLVEYKRPWAATASCGDPG